MCRGRYNDGDLIMQCGFCQRWYHSLCCNVQSEEQAEKLLNGDWKCPMCLPRGNAASIQMLKSREYIVDNVILSSAGYSIVEASKRSRSISPLALSRQVSSVEMAEIQTPSPSDEMMYERADDPSAGGTSVNSSTIADIIESVTAAVRASGGSFDDQEPMLASPTGQDDDGRNRRNRKVSKIGVGGFSAKLVKDRPSFTITKSEAAEDGSGEPVTTMINEDYLQTYTLQGKIRKRRPKKRAEIEECYPLHIQDSFFGNQALSITNASVDALDEALSPNLQDPLAVPVDAVLLKPNEFHRNRHQQHPHGEETLDELNVFPEDIPHDADMLGMIGMLWDEGSQQEKPTKQSISSQDGAGIAGGAGDEDSELLQLPSKSSAAERIAAISRSESNETPPVDISIQEHLQKWEEDEALNEKATISAILYANMRLPQLKSQFQNWTDRAKKIAQLWKELPEHQRAPFIKLARENRTQAKAKAAETSVDSHLKPIKTDTQQSSPFGLLAPVFSPTSNHPLMLPFPPAPSGIPQPPGSFSPVRAMMPQSSPFKFHGAPPQLSIGPPPMHDLGPVGRMPFASPPPPGVNVALSPRFPGHPSAFQHGTGIPPDANNGAAQLPPRDIQYERWLQQEDARLQALIKDVEAKLLEIKANRKPIFSKQQQLKKQQQTLSEEDSNRLKEMGKDLAAQKKVLDDLRKKVQQHASVMQEYRVSHGIPPPPPPASQQPQVPKEASLIRPTAPLAGPPQPPFPLPQGPLAASVIRGAPPRMLPPPHFSPVGQPGGFPSYGPPRYPILDPGALSPTIRLPGAPPALLPGTGSFEGEYLGVGPSEPTEKPKKKRQRKRKDDSGTGTTSRRAKSAAKTAALNLATEVADVLTNLVDQVAVLVDGNSLLML